MYNHGLVTVGKNAREAFILMKYLMSAATIQLQDGSDRRRDDRGVAGDLREGRGAIATHDAGRGAADWPAYLRMIDRIDPGYRN